MGGLLAALIFGLIIFGFSVLMLVPLWFAWLMFAVYSEPYPAAAGVPDPPAVVPEPEPPPHVETELQRPKVMAAGRRGPLP